MCGQGAMTSWVYHPMRSSGELAVELAEVTTLSALSGRKTMRSDTEPESQGVSYSAIRLQSNDGTEIDFDKVPIPVGVVVSFLEPLVPKLGVRVKRQSRLEA